MKYLSIFIGFLITVGLPYKGISQKYKNKEITLIQLNISIQPEIRKYLYQFESSFPSIKNEKADIIIGKIKEKTWEVLQEKLQSEIGMLIKPLSTLGDKINYDPYGFPDAGISKAQKNGDSKYYMKIDIQIGPEIFVYNAQNNSRNKKDSIPVYTKPQEGEMKPMITITLSTYPTNGILILDKFIGGATAPTIWTVDESMLDGLINDNKSDDLSTLMSLIEEAVSDLTINFLTH